MAVALSSCTRVVYVPDDREFDEARLDDDAYAPAWEEDCTWVLYRQGDLLGTSELVGDRRWVAADVRDRRRHQAGVAAALTVVGLGAVVGGSIATQQLDGPSRFGTGVAAAGGLGMTMASIPLWRRRANTPETFREPDDLGAFAAQEGPRVCR